MSRTSRPIYWSTLVRSRHMSSLERLFSARRRRPAGGRHLDQGAVPAASTRLHDCRVHRGRAERLGARGCGRPPFKSNEGRVDSLAVTGGAAPSQGATAPPGDTSPAGPQVAGLAFPPPRTCGRRGLSPLVRCRAHGHQHRVPRGPLCPLLPAISQRRLDFASASHAKEKSVDPARFKLGARTHSIAYLPSEKHLETSS